MTVSKGIALFQVLLMTAIMSVIALAFNFASNEQVDTAFAFQERFEAELELKSAKAELFYLLFTKEPLALSDKRHSGVKWNLRGQPVQLNENTQVRIQALVGLYSLETTPDEWLIALFRNNGLSEGQSTQLLNSIKDWRDPDDQPRFGGAESGYYQGKIDTVPRNGPLQDISELRFIKGMTESLFQKLRAFLTVQPTGAFNPVLAPHELVRLRFNEPLASEIIRMQHHQAYSEENWYQLVGFREFEGVDTHPMSAFRVTLETKVNNIVVTEQFDIELQTQSENNPIVILRQY